MELLLCISYTCLFLYIIQKGLFFRSTGLSVYSLWLVFILKISAGVLMTLIYTYYYTDRSTADIFKYYDDSIVIYRAAYTDFYDFMRMLSGYKSDNSDLSVYYNEMNSWYREFSLNNDNRTMIRLNALMRFFSLNYFYVHVIFMSFLSMAGLTALYKLFSTYVKDRNFELFFIVFLIPSVLFWGSGVLKDAFMLFALGFMLYFTHKVISEKYKLLNYIALILFSFLLIISRAYIMAAVFPGLVCWYWISKSKSNPFGKFLTVHGMYLLIVFNIHYIMPHGYYNALKLLAARQRNFMELAIESNAGSMLDIQVLKPTFLSLLQSLPEALWNVMMRPYFFESFSPLILLSGLENAFITVCILFSLLTLKKQASSPQMLWMSLGFVFICLSLTGLVTPVAGAIVRYKMPALPFLFLILLLISDKRKQVRLLDAVIKVLKKISGRLTE